MDSHKRSRFITAVFVGIIVLLATACNLPMAEDLTNASTDQQNNQEDTPPPTETLTPSFTPTKAPTDTITPSPLPTKTDLPTATSRPSATATVEGILYFNNLDHYEDSQPSAPSEGITRAFAGGELLVHITTPSQGYSLEIYDQPLQDAMVTAWAVFDGDPNSSIGLFCWKMWEDDTTNSRYVFLISRSGHFSLDLRSGPVIGQFTILETLAQGQTDALYPPGEDVWNSVQAVCEGDRLMFFVNGEVLIDVTTDRPTQPGTVGLEHFNGIDTYNLNVRWDMLTVSLP